MTALSSFSLVGVLLALSACTLLDAPKPTDRTAVVKDGPWGKVYRGGYVEIVQPDWRLHSTMTIPPGDRSSSFYVYLCNGDANHCISVAHAQVSFRAQAGHSYRPRAEERVNGSNRFWVWVEDEGTGQPVSDRVPSAPEA